MFCVEAGYFSCSLSLHSAQVGMFTSMRLMHCIRLKTGWTSLQGLSSSHADQEPQCLHASRTCWHCQCTTENYLQKLCEQVEGTHLQDVHVFTLTVRLRFLPSLWRKPAAVLKRPGARKLRKPASRRTVKGKPAACTTPAKAPRKKPRESSVERTPEIASPSSPSSNSSSSWTPNPHGRPAGPPPEAKVVQQDAVCAEHENNKVSPLVIEWDMLCHIHGSPFSVSTAPHLPPRLPARVGLAGSHSQSWMDLLAPPHAGTGLVHCVPRRPFVHILITDSTTAPGHVCLWSRRRVLSLSASNFARTRTLHIMLLSAPPVPSPKLGMGTQQMSKAHRHDMTQTCCAFFFKSGAIPYLQRDQARLSHLCLSS